MKFVVSRPVARKVAVAREIRAPTVQRVVAMAASSDPRQDPSTINIKMQGLNFKLSDSIKSYASEKLSKALKPYEAEVKEVDVKFELHDKNHGQMHGAKQKVELVIYTLHNGTVVISETEEELYAAIDLSLDKLKGKMRKTKEIAQERGTWPGRAGPRGGDMAADLVDEEVDEDKVLEAAAKDGLLGPFKK